MGKTDANAVKVDFASSGLRTPVAFDLANGLIIFSATVNGKNVWGMLDNRAEDSLVDVAFARDQKIRLGPIISPLRTPTGELERRRAYDVPVVIPGQISFTSPLSAVDLSFLSKVAGRPVTVIIGKDFFLNVEMLISFRNKNFQFAPSGSLKMSEESPVIDLVNSRPQFDLYVGKINLRVTLDLGFNKGLALNDQAWRRLGLTAKPQIERESANLQGVLFKTKYTKIARARLGSIELRY